MDPVTSTHGASTKWRRNQGAAPPSEPAYAGSRFADVWRTVSADAYDSLPDKRLRLASASELFAKRLYRAGRRTLERRDDLLPPFDKLVHPSGICLSGTWRITESTPYTGLFRAGTEALIIARASDALGEFRAGRPRVLGLAGKLYPSADPNHEPPLPTANFVLLERLGASRTPYFASATLSNDLLRRPAHPPLSRLPLLALAGAAIALADRTRSPVQPLIRQLYPLAELGLGDDQRAIGPAVMRLVGSPRNRHVESPDVREELQMRHHPDGLRFELQVADRRGYLLPPRFRTIGEVHFTDSVASYSGDHRLHFAHAPYRPRWQR